MDIDNLLVIVKSLISSSLGATIISAVINFFRNKTDRQVEFVTKGRNVWRDEIIAVSEELGKCDFLDINKKSFDTVLQRLKRNINIEGYIERHLYEKEGHIWTEIELLRKAKDEQTFLKHKTILLLELDLLLKVTLTKTKDEIRGKTFSAWNMLIAICIAGLHAIFYFYVCGEDEIIVFVIGAIIASASFLFPSTIIVECFQKIKYIRMDFSIKKILRIERLDFWYKGIQLVLCVILMLMLYALVVAFGVLGVAKNYTYDENEEVSIESNTKLTTCISDSFEKERDKERDLEDIYKGGVFGDCTEIWIFCIHIFCNHSIVYDI